MAHPGVAKREGGVNQVTMPPLVEGVIEGQIRCWVKQPGDEVKKYEALVEVITDKVNAEVPSPIAGRLVEIKVGEGETVAVGTVICTLSVGGEEPAAAAATDAPAAASAPPPAAPAAPAPGPAPLSGQAELTPLSPMRRAIAEHMVRSRQTSPHAWCATEVDMTAVVALRQSEKQRCKAREGVVLPFAPFAFTAAVEA